MRRLLAETSMFTRRTSTTTPHQSHPVRATQKEALGFFLLGGGLLGALLGSLLGALLSGRAGCLGSFFLLGHSSISDKRFSMRWSRYARSGQPSNSHHEQKQSRPRTISASRRLQCLDPRSDIARFTSSSTSTSGKTSINATSVVRTSKPATFVTTRGDVSHLNLC